MSTTIEWTPNNLLEISLEEPDDFLKVKETLTRIGISSKRDHNTLFQSCHILHKQGRYFIVHFKEMFILDGRPPEITEEDIQRRNTIATLLSDWGLIRIVSFGGYNLTCSTNAIKIISHKEKHDWTLLPKYRMGK
jgi:hypothetical protein